MKRNIVSLIGFSMAATDGDIGTVTDFYFEDDSWVVRYLVVETGSWLNGRKVLVSTDAHLAPDWKNKSFPINLTKEQIKHSPDIDTELPVYRQQEIKLYEHYALGNYWRAGYVAGGLPIELDKEMVKKDKEISYKITDDDEHLRSVEKVIGYDVTAIDGAIGTITDFVIDDTNWNIDMLVIDTSEWFTEKNVLLTPKRVLDIKWDKSEVLFDVTMEQIKDSPKYNKDEMWLM